MFLRLRRFVGRFFNKSRKINHQPINKVSLIVIIIVDLFILANVFSGLDDISRWPLSPQQAYPCHSEWQSYRQNSSEDKDYFLIDRAVSREGIPVKKRYQNLERGHLGTVNDLCLQYEDQRAALTVSETQEIIRGINNTKAEINSFTRQNTTIRQQYDSTLLEDIAGQPREQSINAVEAAQAKQEIERNDRAIAQRETTLNELKNDLVNVPVSQAFLSFLADDANFFALDKGYRRTSFWHPSIQLFFQGLFLLPLIVLTSAIHRFAQHKNYGYVSLMSWHLLAIFMIPLIWKVFEFLQVGFLFSWLVEVLTVLFGGLLFLLNYVQILLIPVIGFGIIKFFQKVVFNTQFQATNRVQNMRCVSCAKKIRKHDVHCPHCSYPQYQECHNCHSPTYQHLPYCKHCGTKQAINL